MIAFLLWLGGIGIFVILANALTSWYKLHTDPRYRIFFDLINQETGSVISMNLCVLGDSKKEAEKNLRNVVKRKGNYNIIIYETTKDEPDHNLTEL